MRTGTRLPDGAEWPAPNGAYWRHSNGDWMCVTPNGLLGNLRLHTVTEHEDGTITVSPSIGVNLRRDNPTADTYHGYLERGLWREC